LSYFHQLITAHFLSVKQALEVWLYSLHERLKPDNVYVGLLTIANIISESSPTHSPAVLADKFWQLYQDRTTAEEQQ